MKKKSIIIISALSAIILVIAIVLLTTNTILKKKQLTIIDATFKCAQSIEDFYEDDKYIYSFPCMQSQSVYVKFKNGNKMLVVDALEENKVTIKELLDAGLKVYKKEK